MARRAVAGVTSADEELEEADEEDELAELEPAAAEPEVKRG